MKFLFSQPNTIAIFSLLSISLVGCGGSSTAEPAAEQTNTQAAPAQSAAPTQQTTQATPAPKAATGPKEVDGIPYDIFFDKPLEIAADQTQLGTAPSMASTSTGSNMSSAPPASSEPETPAPSTSNWDDLVNAESLEAEVNAIRNELTAELQSVGTYNRAYMGIPTKAMTMATLAGVGGQMNSDIRWKDNSHFIRELALTISDNSTTTGRTAFNKVQPAFETLLVVLNGGSPSGLPEADPERTLPDYADRGYIMDQMEKWQAYLRSTASNATLLTKEKQMIAQRASVLATITQVLADPEYDYGDEEDYQGYIKQMVDACLEVKSAATNDDYDQFSAAMDQINKACTNCHQQYRD